MVGVDQAQIDKILAGASSEDPEARLDTLEKELDFVKTSVKRLLIDLRERMNELDNPFTNAAAYVGRFDRQDLLPAVEDDDGFTPGDALSTEIHEEPEDVSIPNLDESLFPAEIHDLLPEGMPPALPQAKPAGKLKLQKIHQLFEWVHLGCRKYGHEHMAIMVDAYLTMGYITDDASSQIRDIMRMAPETRNDTLDIGPNEFVSELYILNRILDPDDETLDREMIEVFMSTNRRTERPHTGKPPSRERDAGDTWIELLDRI